MACPVSPGGKVRIRDGRLGVDRDEGAAGHDPADIDRLVDRAGHGRHAVHRGDRGRDRPGRRRRVALGHDAQVATGAIGGLVRLGPRPGGGIRRRERAERGREHEEQGRARVAQGSPRDLLAGQRQHEATPRLEEALGQLGQPRHDPDREDGAGQQADGRRRDEQRIDAERAAGVRRDRSAVDPELPERDDRHDDQRRGPARAAARRSVRMAARRRHGHRPG